MTIANALKEFFFKLTGTRPGGTTISEVIRTGATSVERGIELAEDGKSFILNSSTDASTKKFRVTVVDDGTLTATEVTDE